MREIFLNTFQAEIKDEFGEFVRENQNSDIFCFQEVPHSKVDFYKLLLPNHKSIISHKVCIEDDWYGQAIFYKNNLSLDSWGKLLDENPNVGFVLWIKLNFNKNSLTIVNVHGIPQPGSKLDNDARLLQSKGIIDFLKKISGPKIIGGDFNLLPDTESIQMFEKSGYENLIKDYKITSTRSHFAWEQAKVRSVKQGFEFFGKQNFADYVFVSPEVKVRNFEVPNIEVSDHLPLILDIEV